MPQALKFSDPNISNGRYTSMNAPGYDGYPVTAAASLTAFATQIPAQNGQPLAANGVYATTTGTITVNLDGTNTAVITVATAPALIPITYQFISAATATGLYSLFRVGG